jgi:hypothetical protein
MVTDLFYGIALWPRPEGWLWMLIAAVVIPLAATVLLAGVTVGFVSAMLQKRR